MPAPAQLRAFEKALDDLDDIYGSELDYADVYCIRVYRRGAGHDYREGNVVVDGEEFRWRQEGGPKLEDWSWPVTDPAGAAADIIDTLNAAKVRQ